jgi:hypothetical protein
MKFKWLLLVLLSLLILGCEADPIVEYFEVVCVEQQDGSMKCYLCPLENGGTQNEVCQPIAHRSP